MLMGGRLTCQMGALDASFKEAGKPPGAAGCPLAAAATWFAAGLPPGALLPSMMGVVDRKRGARAATPDRLLLWTPTRDEDGGGVGAKRSSMSAARGIFFPQMPGMQVAACGALLCLPVWMCMCNVSWGEYLTERAGGKPLLWAIGASLPRAEQPAADAQHILRQRWPPSPGKKRHFWSAQQCFRRFVRIQDFLTAVSSRGKNPDFLSLRQSRPFGEPRWSARGRQPWQGCWPSLRSSRW